MDAHRALRVSEALREELAEIIEYELSDPRLAGVTVTGAHVTPDLRHAQVLVVAGGSGEQGRKAIEALEHASTYLRAELSRRLRLWRVPELHFAADEPGGAASRVEELLARVRKSQKKDTGNSEK
jgi:ribosome-binding factor A